MAKFIDLAAHPESEWARKILADVREKLPGAGVKQYNSPRDVPTKIKRRIPEDWKWTLRDEAPEYIPAEILHEGRQIITFIPPFWYPDWMDDVIQIPVLGTIRGTFMGPQSSERNDPQQTT